MSSHYRNGGSRATSSQSSLAHSTAVPPAVPGAQPVPQVNNVSWKSVSKDNFIFMNGEKNPAKVASGKRAYQTRQNNERLKKEAASRGQTPVLAGPSSAPVAQKPSKRKAVAMSPLSQEPEPAASGSGRMAPTEERPAKRARVAASQPPPVPASHNGFRLSEKAAGKQREDTSSPSQAQPVATGFGFSWPPTHQDQAPPFAFAKRGSPLVQSPRGSLEPALTPSFYPTNENYQGPGDQATTSQAAATPQPYGVYGAPGPVGRTGGRAEKEYPIQYGGRVEARTEEYPMPPAMYQVGTFDFDLSHIDFEALAADLIALEDNSNDSFQPPVVFQGVAAPNTNFGLPYLTDAPIGDEHANAPLELSGIPQAGPAPPQLSPNDLLNLLQSLGAPTASVATTSFQGAYHPTGSSPPEDKWDDFVANYTGTQSSWRQRF